MSAITTDSSTYVQKVWVQREGCESMRLTLEPHIKIIDGVKEMVFGNIRDEYDAFHRGQYLRPDRPIPTDTSDEEPIKLKRINDRRCKCFFSPVPANQILVLRYCMLFLFSAIPSIEGDINTSMGLQTEIKDERGTRTMRSNPQLADKSNKFMNKSESNCT
jgi:hypothetical protein